MVLERFVMAIQKTSKKGKRPDHSPHRAHYWASGRLATRKIRNLLDSGYTLAEAERVWRDSRKRYYGAEPNLRSLARHEAR